MNQSFVVFGLGKFGSSVVMELSNVSADVLAIDINKEHVQAFSDIATCAVCADICDIETMFVSMSQTADFAAALRNLPVSLKFFGMYNQRNKQAK